MNGEQTDSWFRNKIEIPDGDPKEVIYEVVIGEDNAGLGFAVADITESAPHYHNKMTEVYTLVSGRMVVRMVMEAGAEETFLFLPGQTVIIPPGTIHSAASLTAEPARVAVQSFPPWTPEDHILVEEQAGA